MAQPARQSAAQRAFASVRARILDGSLAGGRLISEGEVAEELGMSRTPVREAFLQLAGQHMLELYPKRGAMVVPVDAGGLRDVLVARGLVEPWAAERAAAPDGRDARVAQLRAAAAVAARALADRQAPLFQDADREFHETLVGYGESPLVSAFYTTLRNRQLRGATLAVQRRPQRAAEVVAEHAAIVEAIAAGDVAGAVAAVDRHLAGTALALGLAPLR